MPITRATERNHLSGENEIISLGGPVERVDGRLVLQIPLAAGGAALVPYSRGIARVESDTLVVTIPDWLAEKLGIGEGSSVIVDNRNGKFNITRDVPDTDDGSAA